VTRVGSVGQSGPGDENVLWTDRLAYCTEGGLRLCGQARGLRVKRQNRDNGQETIELRTPLGRLIRLLDASFQLVEYNRWYANFRGRDGEEVVRDLARSLEVIDNCVGIWREHLSFSRGTSAA
jgi:hypothetical protein